MKFIAWPCIYAENVNWLVCGGTAQLSSHKHSNPIVSYDYVVDLESSKNCSVLVQVT